jgi:predicted N-formylglutamate amidohydrolase
MGRRSKSARPREIDVPPDPRQLIFTMPAGPSLLCADDPAPVITKNPNGTSPFLLVCDHAGRHVPRTLGDLGVPPADWDRHIAWDIGAGALTGQLGQTLDATSIEQVYSRLVIDCNRTPGHPTSIAPSSDGTSVPGNQDLGEAERAARVVEIFEPYHDAISAEVQRRLALGCKLALVAVHSFTPVMAGIARPWQAAVLYNRDPRLGHALAARLKAKGLIIGDNEPYYVTDETDYTIPVHAERRGLPYLELEVRQDMIADPAGQADWAALLAELLPPSAEAAGIWG